MKKYDVAVVGATGAVGLEMIKMLELRNFPMKSLRLLASERSAGKKLKTSMGEIAVEVLNPGSAKGLDVALFSAGGGTSKKFAPFAVSVNELPPVVALEGNRRLNIAPRRSATFVFRKKRRLSGLILGPPLLIGPSDRAQSANVVRNEVGTRH